jgi:hypothetical protein
VKIKTVLLVSATLATFASPGAADAQGFAIRRSSGSGMVARRPTGVGVAAVRRNGKMIGRSDSGTHNADGTVRYDPSQPRVKGQTNSISGVYAPQQ